MKTFFSQFKVGAWILGILLVLNVSALGTILYGIYHQHRIIRHNRMELPFRHPQPGIFLKEELNLTDKQFGKFDKARANYQQTASQLNIHLVDLKRAYIQELMKDAPDTAFMRTTADSIGLLHTDLIRQTGIYYKEIRQLCNPEQVDRLNEFFKRIMQPEEMGMMPGRMIRHRMQGATRRHPAMEN